VTDERRRHGPRDSHPPYDAGWDDAAYEQAHQQAYEQADGHHHHEPLGTVVDEAAKLFAAFGDRARRSGLGSYLGGHVATGEPECLLCPVCQIIGVLRDARPELVDHLSDAMGSLVAAAKAALTANERQRAAARRPRTGRFEHIDIG